MDTFLPAMETWRRRPSRGDCWESDRGIRAQVNEVRDDSVVIELIEARLPFSMERKVFELTFKHLAYSHPGLPEQLPDVSGRHN